MTNIDQQLLFDDLQKLLTKYESRDLEKELGCLVMLMSAMIGDQMQKFTDAISEYGNQRLVELDAKIQQDKESPFFKHKEVIS